MLVSLTWLAGADSLWDWLQQARPELARQRIARPTPLQSALLAQAEGEDGEAWRLIRQLESHYQPGAQPAEFFWVRGLLLRSDNGDLCRKNMLGLLERPVSRPMRLAALTVLAQSAAEDHLQEESDRYWVEATSQAALLPPDQISSLIRLELVQAQLQLIQNQPAQALATLLAARALASRADLPALAALVEMKMARVDIELTDWQAFPNTCLRALDQARRCQEPWLVEKICSFWVEQQLARRSELRAVSQCVNALDMAQGWFQGASRLQLIRSLARARANGLNQRPQALALLDQALGGGVSGRLRVILLADRVNMISPSQKPERRQALLKLVGELERLGPLQPEDPLLRSLPRRGVWAALADTYLPDHPEQAQRYFEKALQQAPDLGARLEAVNYQLARYNSVGAAGPARRTLTQLLELVRQAPLDQQASRIVRSQMFGLRNEALQMNRLLMTDEIRPAPESPAMIVLAQLLQEEALQVKLEREVYERIRRAQSYQESTEAYQARAELLITQNRNSEAVLALERMRQSAHQGGWPLKEAAAFRMLADTYWTLGRSPQALESVRAAEALYTTSANRRDQRSLRDCRRLQAYYLLRTGQPAQALDLCQPNDDDASTFLSGRCYLALGQLARAEQAFAHCHFDEGDWEVTRLLFQARASNQPGPLYEQAYQKARQLDDLSLRDVCLEWTAWLRQQGQGERAQQIEQEAAAQVTALLQDYPPQVRDRLLDLPATQKLLKSSPSPVRAPDEPPRESRRTFLARMNELRQRYPSLDSELAVSPSDLTVLQESLPDHRVLLQYFAADTDLYVMRADASGCSLIQVAVERSVLQDWGDQLRSALSHGGDLPEGPAHQLYLSLVQPLGPGLEGAQVQVIPNGFFWYLPWDVLRDERDRYLVETQEWSCAAPSELLRGGFRRHAPAPPLETVLSLGATSSDLPATGLEATRVASLFPHGQALLGPQATSVQLMQLAPQAQVLHLAAHSGLSSDLNQTYIQLSDGRFSLEQVYGLELTRGTRVVLSSCDSAVGQAAPGREVSSLASAFLASGASSVVATLWPVEDDVSAAFFARFYPLLLQHQSISQALRQARLDCLANPRLRQPAGWGAYQLIGDPQ